MAMPPLPKPSQASEVAKAGTARRPSDSAAISLSATMVIHGAPNDSARITSNTVAMIHDDRVSTDGRPMRSCIIGPWLLRRREGDVVVTGVLPALDALKQFAAAARGDSERCRGGEHGLERRCHRRSSLGLFLFERGIYRFPARAARAWRWGQPCAKRRPTSKRRATQARNGAREPGPCCGQAPNKVVDHFVNWRMRARDKRRRISGMGRRS